PQPPHHVVPLVHRARARRRRRHLARSDDGALAGLQCLCGADRRRHLFIAEVGADPAVRPLVRHRQHHRHLRRFPRLPAADGGQHRARRHDHATCSHLERACARHPRAQDADADLPAPRASRHLHRAAHRARLFVRAGDLLGNDRLDQRYRQARLHVWRERHLRLHVRGDRLHRHRRLSRRPRAAGDTAPGAALARIRGRGFVMAKAPSLISLRLRSIASILLLIAIWEIAGRAKLAPPILLPPFSVVAAQLWQSAADASLFVDLAISLLRAFAGLALAGVIGILLGMSMAHSRAANWLVDPIVALAFPSPKIAFLPVFVLWFGIESTSKILLVAFACVFPVIIGTYSAARAVSRIYFWSAASLGTG